MQENTKKTQIEIPFYTIGSLSKLHMGYRDWEEYFVKRDYGPLLDHIKGPF